LAPLPIENVASKIGMHSVAGRSTYALNVRCMAWSSASLPSAL
jgi:hypothetical protein